MKTNESLSDQFSVINFVQCDDVSFFLMTIKVFTRKEKSTIFPTIILKSHREMRYRRLSQRKICLIASLSVLLIISHEAGLFVHLFELGYTTFNYPLMVNNLQEIVNSHIRQETVFLKESSVKPINGYNYSFLISNGDKCRSSFRGGEGDDTAGDDDDGEGGYGNNGESENGNPEAIDGLVNKDNGSRGNKSMFDKITLVLMIKSALGNRAARDAIRQTWGREDRFSDVPLRRVFVVGNCEGSISPESADECDKLIGNESREFGDLIQADFIDTYFNNTIKTMMAMKWIVNHCPRASFVLFVDDDFYISPRNLLRFVRRPFYDPDNLESRHSIPSRFIPRDGRLYAGFVFGNSAPMRHKLSKWFISLEDYPYEKYPPYVTAGAFVLSIRTVKEMYYASLYTKNFKFDDIYVGILAKKLNLEPFHNKNFHYWRKSYDPLGYGRVIASHGFDDQNELIKVFLEQKSLGHA